jgi:hypothetical protein
MQSFLTEEAVSRLGETDFSAQIRRFPSRYIADIMRKLVDLTDEAATRPTEFDDGESVLADYVCDEFHVHGTEEDRASCKRNYKKQNEPNFDAHSR